MYLLHVLNPMENACRKRVLAKLNKKSPSTAEAEKHYFSTPDLPPACVDSPIHEFDSYQDHTENDLSVVSEGFFEDLLFACVSAISKTPCNDQIGIVSQLFSKCLKNQCVTMAMPEDSFSMLLRGL